MIPNGDFRAGGDEAFGDSTPKALRPAGHNGAAAVQIDLVHCAIPLLRRPASKRPAAIDDMGDPGRERALVAGEIDGKGSYFLRRAEPSHRLAAHEHFAPLRTRRGSAGEHRRGLDGPWTDTVAANALCYEIG